MLTDLVEAIEAVTLDGLEPAHYHVDGIRALQDPPRPPTPSGLADLDLLATDGFLVLGSHLLHGRRTERTFSSGCIRVERPLELAEYLLRGDPYWTPERIREAAVAGSETTVTLAAPVPVHLQYLTAFVDDDGRVNYRRDIYGRDATLLAVLRSGPPGE